MARPFHLGASYAPHGDTTFTKIFVGGLAWETQRDTMRLYFEQFGDILEAVVITDKNTGRSKGYGFVTFKDPDSAMRACQDPFPVIDGRRANCNLASLGATHRTRPPPPHYGSGRIRPQSSSAMSIAAYRGSSAGSVSTTAYFHQPTHYAWPYNLYGYSGVENNMYPMSCYYGAQQQQHQFTPYYPANPGVYSNYYPYSHSGFGLHYQQQMLQYPTSYLPQQFGPGSPILSLPAAGVSSVSAAAAPNSAGCVRPAVLAPNPASRPPSSTASEHNVSTRTAAA